MTRLTRFFALEFRGTEGMESYFYDGPGMDLEEFELTVKRVRTAALKELGKEGEVNEARVKYRMDKLMRERGFVKHEINVAEVNSYSPINISKTTTPSQLNNSLKSRKKAKVKS